VKDVGFIVKYSSEQRLISFSDNVRDLGNAVNELRLAKRTNGIDR